MDTGKKKLLLRSSIKIYNWLIVMYQEQILNVEIHNVKSRIFGQYTFIHYVYSAYDSDRNVQ